MELPLHTTGGLNDPTSRKGNTPKVEENGAPNQNGDDLKIGEKSKIEVASDVVKSAASAITNGLNSLKVSN